MTTAKELGGAACRPPTDDLAVQPHVDRLERCCVMAGCEPIEDQTAGALERIAAARGSSLELSEILRVLAAVGLDVPGSLADAAIKVERSLAICVLATASLRAAASAPSAEERAALLDDAVAFAGFADDLYRDALSELCGVLAAEKDRAHH